MSGARRLEIGVAAAIVVLTNVVALAGVAWNRSGDPDSELALGPRELWVRTAAGPRDETTALSAELTWRLPDRTGTTPELPPMDRQGRVLGRAWGSGEPAWLDRDRLSALGFRTELGDRSERARALATRQLPRPIYLVLEMDGPAHQAALAEYRRMADAASRATPTADSAAASRRQVDHLRAVVDWAEHRASRLVLIDGGPDRDALRDRYPDRHRHAIVRGVVYPIVAGPTGAPRLAGRVEITGDRFIVPRSAAAVLSPEREGAGTSFAIEADSLVGVRVAFGRRLEPWLVDVNRKGR